jgi:hypothetical protein
MNRKVILAVGQNEFLNTNKEWDVIAVTDAEAAIEKFHQADVDMVVFANCKQQDAVKLKKLFLFQHPEIIIVQNNRADLNAGQIQAALETRKQENRPSFSFVDDALKAAELPITIQ